MHQCMDFKQRLPQCVGGRKELDSRFLKYFLFWVREVYCRRLVPIENVFCRLLYLVLADFKLLGCLWLNMKIRLFLIRYRNLFHLSCKHASEHHQIRIHAPCFLAFYKCGKPVDRETTLVRLSLDKDKETLHNLKQHCCWHCTNS